MVRLDSLGRVGPAPHSHSVFARLRIALTVWRQRRQLDRLDAEQLTDLGLTADDAAREAARPIWDVPGHWRA